MSLRVSKLARRYCEDHNVGGARRTVLLDLADAGRDDGISWHGQEEIAKRTVLTPEWVRKCMRQLEKDGVVETRKAHQAGKPRVCFNVYRVCLEGVAELDSARLDEHGITLLTPFTTGTEFRSSEPDDRNSAPPTTGTPRRFSEGDPFIGTRKEDPEEERGAHLQLIEGNGEVVEPSVVISAYFEQQAKARGAPPPDRTVATVEKLSDELLGKGYTERDIRRGIDRMLDKGLGAQLLDRLVFEAKVSGRSRGLTPAEIAAMGDEEMGGAMSARPSGRREGS